MTDRFHEDIRQVIDTSRKLIDQSQKLLKEQDEVLANIEWTKTGGDSPPD